MPSDGPTNVKPKIRVTRRLPEAVEDYAASRFGAQLNTADDPLSRDALVHAMRTCDILVPTITDHIDRSLVSGADVKVRLIANFGAGIEHIDCQAAADAGIIVTNTPGALTEATSELAILLMLMAARRAGEGERQLRAGQWTGWRPTHLMGLGLTGRTLGLVGFGRIAQMTAAKAKAFGMKIRYFSRTPGPPDVVAGLGAERDGTLGDLAAAADVLSVHVPGGAATRHLIDADVLRVMQPHAILVNTARGMVVDEEALADALAQGSISAAALDVYEREPHVCPQLLDSDRSVLLPHLGSATIQARTAMGMQAFRNVEAFLEGREPPDRVG